MAKVRVRIKLRVWVRVRQIGEILGRKDAGTRAQGRVQRAHRERAETCQIAAGVRVEGVQLVCHPEVLYGACAGGMGGIQGIQGHQGAPGGTGVGRE